LSQKLHKMKQFITLLTTILLCTINGEAQNLTQTIRGKVVDKESNLPLTGANIVLLNSSPIINSISDNQGNFRLNAVPIGRQTIQITFLGYKPSTVANLIVNSVKEVILDIALEENVIQANEVVIKAYAKKEEALNKMAAVSARMFTVEETEKFAGSRGDVARMAMNYAGVATANDSRNDIVIRGNSPSGLLWKLEDVEIPNPNHFAENGTTGGPVGMLNNNLMQNSDFFTGAFPAEYSNALSGVFDLKMRSGNNEKHEYLFQCGFNGFEAGAEGPLSKKHNSSYLANFRYSTLELVDNFVNFGTSGVPKYKDFSFKLNFPFNKGRLSIFGLAGISSIDMLDSKRKEKDMYTDDGMDLYNHSKMLTSGISITRFIGEKTYYKLTLSGNIAEGGSIIDTLDFNNQPHLNIDHQYTDFRVSLNGMIHTKYSSHFSTKAGFNIDRMGFDLNTSVYKTEDQGMRKILNDRRNLYDGVTLYRTYYEGTYKFNDQFSINPGLNFLYFNLNGVMNLEPRLGLVWQVAPKHKLSAGYGFHSRIQNLSTYYLETYLPDHTIAKTNVDLGLTKSHQWVLGYECNLSANTHFKSEAYYQYLYKVPVEVNISSYSILNSGAYWGINANDSLINNGTGSNYGLEFTLERFFSKNIYYLTTLSLFNSKYTGSDGIERNTAFNSKYVWNALVGKEFPIKKRMAVTVDLKITLAGGKFYTPIDLEKSKLTGEAEYIDSKAFSKQFSPFFKTDIKIGFRLNGRKVSQEWQVYIENLTDHKNLLVQNYSRKKQEITNTYQLGFFPMVQYRIHF
jgi:hypothetical protein